MNLATRGFALLEVLIAVLVLGIGLLGVAGLQSATLSINQGALQRSQASILARDIADRMRANPRAVADGKYDTAGGNTPAATAACETASGCGTTAMALHDLEEWQTNLEARLPAASGTVCIDDSPADGTPGAPACSGSGDNYAIKIWWFERQDEERRRFITEFRP